MSYDLEHETIYSTRHEPVRMDGDIVIGHRYITVSKTKGDPDFMVMVKTGASAFDRASTDVIRITPEMLAAMVAQ